MRLIRTTRKQSSGLPSRELRSLTASKVTPERRRAYPTPVLFAHECCCCAVEMGKSEQVAKLHARPPTDDPATLETQFAIRAGRAFRLALRWTSYLGCSKFVVRCWAQLCDEVVSCSVSWLSKSATWRSRNRVIEPYALSRSSSDLTAWRPQPINHDGTPLDRRPGARFHRGSRQPYVASAA